VRGLAETLKERALLALAKSLEDGRVYRFKTIKKLLVSAGLSIPYANRILDELELYGVLERVSRGEYKFHRLRLRRAYGVG
jgi:hypothetical protein